MRASILLALAACSGSTTAAPSVAKPPPWTIPVGWKSETIPFPLDFAPGIGHRGVEELRFAPGMFDPAAPGYWSYVFVWRTEDAAQLAAPILAAELTTYFRGLIAAVDDKHAISSIEDILVHATGAGEGATRIDLAAHIFDAFKTGAPVDLVGWAKRTECKTGAVWVFVLAPAKTGIRDKLDVLAADARCDQSLPPAAPKKP